MLSNSYNDMCEPNNYDNSVTIKVEQPEYNPLEIASTTQTTVSNNLCFHEPDKVSNGYSDTPYKSGIYDKMEDIMSDDSVMMDYIENSIDNLLVEYRKDKAPQEEKLRKGAERQRVYRQNETEIQRERRLEMARQYIKNKRQTESHEQRYNRLKKQRERIRSIREAMKSNPEIYTVRKQIEAERMKMRRANESPIQRMKRLEKSRSYSKKRRENEVYRILENEKNRLAHQCRRSDESFRLQERLRDRARKKIKNEIFIETDTAANLYESELTTNFETNTSDETEFANIHEPEISICGTFTSIPVPCSNDN